MSSPYLDYQRDGLNALLNLCKAMCRLIQQWEPVIREKYGDNVGIIALLDLNLELCALLPAALTEFSAISLDQTLPPADPSSAAGINPDAPDAVDPDFT
jgi:hypothetical protein